MSWVGSFVGWVWRWGGFVIGTGLSLRWVCHEVGFSLGWVCREVGLSLGWVCR